MKMWIHWVAVGAAAFLALEMAASAVEMRKSENWEGKYEATVNPESDGWTEEGTGYGEVGAYNSAGWAGIADAEGAAGLLLVGGYVWADACTPPGPTSGATDHTYKRQIGFTDSISIEWREFSHLSYKAGTAWYGFWVQSINYDGWSSGGWSVPAQPAWPWLGRRWWTPPGVATWRGGIKERPVLG